ncbi:MAG: uracil-DNA glycosylase [Burkholderiales bacterium]
MTRATRADILRELKLAPLWVHRSAAPSATAPRDGGTSGSEADVAPPESLRDVAAREVRTDRVPAAPVDAEARIVHIANLSFDDFDADVAACTACRLCQTRKRAVPGVGDRHADWMFIGEAPGAEEDARGEPFVGQAGRLLDNMLGALGLARTERVYIANVLKCRPPNNRTPEPAEAEACQPYLARQIELVAPKIIVALGKSAATLLLGTDASIARLRGRVHRYRGVPLVVTYHPAYLLRNLPDKAKAWDDLLLARRTAAA